jgi:hypothetical protein
MRLIALAGLVSVEKMQLALDLARYYREQGASVTIIDTIARLYIEPASLSGETLIRPQGDIFTQLPALLTTIEAEVVVWAVSETAAPETLFGALDDLDGVDTLTLALIDTRTCDCFPNLRVSLETHADLIVNLPYDFYEIVARMETVKPPDA